MYPIHAQCVRFAVTQYSSIVGFEIDLVDVRLYCGREFIRVYSGSATKSAPTQTHMHTLPVCTPSTSAFGLSGVPESGAPAPGRLMIKSRQCPGEFGHNQEQSHALADIAMDFGEGRGVFANRAQS